MRPENFDTSEFGKPVRLPNDQFWWFCPAPIPRELSMDPDTQLALSLADTAVGRLAGVGRMLRNPGLITRPYAVREALASARIEGTQATLTDVFQAEAAQQQISVNEAASVSFHIAALNRGLIDVRKNGLSLESLCLVHRALMHDTQTGHPGGSFRKSPVWLGSPMARLETAEFVPPIGEAMSEALGDWENFLHNPPRLPLLIRIALLHYQFLTIHPFIDGNGRVGRMLVQLLLENDRLLPSPLLYVSAYLAERRSEYYDRLQAVRERGEIQQWLQFFLTAVAVQAEDGVERAVGLLDLREKYRANVSGGRSRISDVIELLFENPVITAAVVREQLQVSTQGALNLLRALESRSWVQSLGNFGRGGATYWAAVEIIELLNRPFSRALVESGEESTNATTAGSDLPMSTQS